MDVFLVATFALPALALLSGSRLTYGFTRDQLVGTWCFYEQQAVGNTVQERVTISPHAAGANGFR